MFTERTRESKFNTRRCMKQAASNPAKWRRERHAACLEDATDATQPLWPTLPVARGWCCTMLLCYLLPPAECVSLHLVTRPVNPLRSIRTCVTPRSRVGQ